jgi:hypothetical protein
MKPDALKPGILDGKGLRSGGSQSSSVIGSKSKSKIVARTGNEAPATQELVDVIANRQTRPGVQLPGERTRKIPGPLKANSAGEADHVQITHGSLEYSSASKQTWKGAKAGYTVREEPKYVPAPAKDTWQDTRPWAVGSKPTNNGDYTGKNVHLNGDIKRGGGSAAQSVKGKRPPRTDGEAKPVAGTTRDQSR